MKTNWIGEAAMTNHKKPKGWVKEPGRHAMAARGIKSGRKATVRGITYHEDSGVMMEPLLKAEMEDRKLGRARIVRSEDRPLIPDWQFIEGMMRSEQAQELADELLEMGASEIYIYGRYLDDLNPHSYRYDVYERSLEASFSVKEASL
jgi:hypothetical protein